MSCKQQALSAAIEPKASHFCDALYRHLKVKKEHLACHLLVSGVLRANYDRGEMTGSQRG